MFPQTRRQQPGVPSGMSAAVTGVKYPNKYAIQG